MSAQASLAPRQVCTLHPRRSERGPSQAYRLVAHVGRTIRVDQARAHEAAAIESADDARVGEIRTIEFGTRELRLVQPGPLQAGIAEIRVHRPGHVEFRVVESGADQLGVVEPATPQVGAGEVQTRKVQTVEPFVSQVERRSGLRRTNHGFHVAPGQLGHGHPRRGEVDMLHHPLGPWPGRRQAAHRQEREQKHPVAAK